jgi:hypothetical protein
MVTRRNWLSGLFNLGVLSGLGPLAQAAEQRTRLVVVVQKGSPLSELSLRDLKRLYTSERLTDPSGNAILPLNQPRGAADRTGFDRLVLKMDAEEVGRYWIDRKIRGQPGAPKAVSPLETLRSAVASIPGAIAYMRESDVDGRLKVLTVEGKHLGDTDYPLQY